MFNFYKYMMINYFLTRKTIDVIILFKFDGLR
jgi:hypothetical protein